GGGRRGRRVDRADLGATAVVDDAGGAVALRGPLGDGVRRDAQGVTVQRGAVVLLLREGRQAAAAGVDAGEAAADRLQEERVGRGGRRRLVDVDRTRLSADLAPVGDLALEDVLELGGRQRGGRRIRVADRRVGDGVAAL